MSDPLDHAEGSSPQTARLRIPVLMVALIALFGVLVLSRTLFFGYVHYFNDTGLAFYPWHHFIAAERAAGNWLPWCHLHGCGYPLWSNGQTGVFYPPNLLFLLPLDTPWVFGFLTWLHHVLAAVGVFVLARMMRIGSAGAMVAGIVFGFSGFLWAHQIQYAMLCAVAWMPWCAVGAILWGHHRSGGGMLLCALSFAAAVLNHPQPPLIIAPFTVAVVWAYGALLPERRRSILEVAGSFGLLLVPLVLGGLLAAVAWVPMLQLMAAGFGSEREGYEFITSFSVAPRDMVRLFFPRFVRVGIENAHFERWIYWEVCGYVGGVALAGMIIIAPAQRVLRSLRTRLLAVFAASLLLAFGGNTPVYRIFEYMPAYDRFRVPGRWLSIWSLAAALLIGLAVTVLPARLKEEGSTRTLARLMLIFGVAVAGLGAGLAIGQATGWRPMAGWIVVGVTVVVSVVLLVRARWSGPPAPPPRAVVPLAGAGALAFGLALPLRYTPHLLPDIFMLAAGALACAAAFFMVLRGRLRPVTGAHVFAMIAVLQVAHFAWTFFPVSADREILHWPAEVMEHSPGAITEGRFLTYYTDWMPEAPWPNTHLIDGIANADIYDPFSPPMRWLTRTLDAQLLDPQTAAALGVSRIITDVPPDEAPSGLEFMGMVPSRVPWRVPVYVYRNPAFRGIAWTVTEHSPPRVKGPPPEAQPVLSMDAPSLEPPPAWSERPGRPGAVSVAEWEARRIRIEVGGGERRVLLLTHARLPGWSASIDGVPAPLMTANGVFTALELPDGACEVLLSYRPHGLRAGAVLTSMAAAMVFTLFALTRRRRARSDG
ncbi:MAG: YfhO family protein [Armatimonadota bacterium]